MPLAGSNNSTPFDAQQQMRSIIDGMQQASQQLTNALQQSLVCLSFSIVSFWFHFFCVDLQFFYLFF
jgi:hypothetical protein